MDPLHSLEAPTPCPPPEIWRSIFSIATYIDTPYPKPWIYEPFQPPRELEETARLLDQEALRFKTCLSLTRVCKLWRQLAEEFLYEDVRVLSAPALQSLVSGMQRSADEEGSEVGYGRHIRRLELPTKPTNFKDQASMPSSFHLSYPTYTPLSLCLGEVLRYCPRLEVLIRPSLRLDADDIHFWGGLITAPIEGTYPLCPNLKRLEWSESDLDMRFYGTANNQRLAEIITNAPQLSYLFVSCDRPDVLTHLPLGESLHTLRLNRSHYHHSRLVKEVKNVANVVNLTNLVLHTTVGSAALAFIAAVGCRLRVLEFTFAPQVTYSSNQVQRILSRCPNLEELVYHLGAPEISPLKVQHAALKRVRIKINSEVWFPHKHVVLSQFEILAGPSFPSLSRVYLHDASKSFVRRESASPLLLRMIDRGRPVVYEDGGSVVPFPKRRPEQSSPKQGSSA